MGNLKNHPSAWLRDDAAAAFNQAEDDFGIFDLNSAGRTPEEQQRLIDRWNRGGPLNRPPYLYQPAVPAGTSNHVRNGGVAVDLGDWERFAVICEKYGFKHTYPGGDKVHFDFVGLPSAPAVPAPKGHVGTVADLATLPDRRGLQKLIKHYSDYKGRIDNDFGPLSKRSFQKWLDKNYGGSLAKWLRHKWGYKDKDDIWGRNMRAAAMRANAANWNQLK